MINPIYSPAPERYDNGMKFRRCGQSGILLPEISLGLWHNFGDMNTFANSQAMAHYAFDRESRISTSPTITVLPTVPPKRLSE